MIALMGMDMKGIAKRAYIGKTVAVSNMKQDRSRFLLLKPDSRGNASDLARIMASWQGVERVHITSGEFGFVILARKRHATAIMRKLRKLTNGSAVDVEAHFSYRSTSAKK